MKLYKVIAIFTVSCAVIGWGVALLGQAKPPAPKPPAAPKVPEVRMAVGLNCSRDATVKSGDPVLIELAVSVPWGEGGAVTKTLSKPGGSWGDLISIEIRGVDGKPIPGISVKPLVRGDASITLDADRGGWLAWSLDPSAMSAGKYKVYAILDTPAGAPPTQKKATSPACELTVSAGAPSGDDARMSALAKIRIHTYRNELDQALAAAKAGETAFPDDTIFVEEQGDALARKKQYKEAVKMFDLALSKVPAPPTNAVPEPPFDLIDKRKLAAAEAAKAGG